MQQAARADPFRVVFAAAVPFALLALAYASWAITDRIGSIGPLDKAKLGWLIVVPLVSVAPVAAGIAWRRLTDREAITAAIVLGIALGVGVAAIYWLATAHPNCQVGSRMTELDALGISAGVGLVAGVGFALSGMLTRKVIRNGHPWWAGLVGAGTGFGTFWLVVFAAVALTLPYWGSCNRGPV